MIQEEHYGPLAAYTTTQNGLHHTSTEECDHEHATDSPMSPIGEPIPNERTIQNKTESVPSAELPGAKKAINESEVVK